MNQKDTFDTLNEQLKDIPKAQIRLMSLAVLPRLMGALDNNKSHCVDCKRYSNSGEEFIKNIRPLFSQDRQAQQNFENWVTEAQKHLKTRHQQQVKGRITSTYATIGMLAGCALALFYLLLTNGSNYIGGISLGWALGMISGYIVGKTKENKLSRNHKVY